MRPIGQHGRLSIYLWFVTRLKVVRAPNARFPYADWGEIEAWLGDFQLRADRGLEDGEWDKLYPN